MRLSARDVSYMYPRGDHQVLAGVAFDIPAGISAAFVGPSGSGKTTLLSLMGHLLPMQSGVIAAVDEDGHERSLADTASWVLQTVSLLPDRTAADNVAVGAYSDGASRADARDRAVEYLAAVGLAGHDSDSARILSGERRSASPSRGLSPRAGPSSWPTSPRVSSTPARRPRCLTR